MNAPQLYLELLTVQFENPGRLDTAEVQKVFEVANTASAGATAE